MNAISAFARATRAARVCSPRVRSVQSAVGGSALLPLVSTGHALRLSTLAWGAGSEGKLGLGGVQEQLKPMRIASLDGKQVTAIAGGVNHSAAIVQEAGKGKVYTWGSNFYGQVGYMPELKGGLMEDDEDVVAEPKWLRERLEDDNVVQLACGDFHSIVLSDKGVVLAWGAGLIGQGNEYFESRPLPIKFFEDNAQTVHVHRVGAKLGLSYATASPSSETPPTDLYIWGHYDAGGAEQTALRRVKSTRPSLLSLGDKLDAISHVAVSSHLVVVQGTREGKSLFLAFGSHPSVRATNITDAPECPLYPILEKVETVNGASPLTLLAQLSEGPNERGVRDMLVVQDAIVVLRDNGRVDFKPIFSDVNARGLDKETSLSVNEPIVSITASPLVAVAVGQSGTIYEWKAVYPTKIKPSSMWSWFLDTPAEKEAKLNPPPQLPPMSLLDALVSGTYQTRGVVPEPDLLATGWDHFLLTTKGDASDIESS
ncbi:regulator of chromosome condensation 1/beta-lactamase-inhibitor protein II [Entophlyctis helioformis]|nr:regulator of chromosome condensation 1/beta-lactamase-inhibitor protein II [Entophlyctis helioformis]